MFAFTNSDLSFPPFLFQKISAIWGIYVLAWLLTCVFLIVAFRWAKPRLRAQALHFDRVYRALAHHVRFGSHEHEDEALRRERVMLTWFFRFWTNFASAPSLTTLSLLVPFLAYHRIMASGVFNSLQASAWLLPGLCYAGSMLLSWVLKRVFKRLRPPLKTGDFGHKLVKDPSFPSGHSLTSFCFWAMVPVAAYFYGSLPLVVGVLGFISAVTVLLTGLSRIYLRVHFPSDVAGGFIIGTLWTVACLIVLPSALKII